MAQQNVGIGGQSQASSHSGGWAGSPSATVWDQTRNIVESVEGGASDFGSGRSAEWEVKNATWEWDQVGPVYSTRHLDVHSPAIAFASGGQTVDGLAGASPGTHGALVLKHDGVLHDNSHADSSRVGKLSSVEQHPPTQVSILSPDQRRRLALELGEGGSSTERRKNNVQDFGGSSTLMGMGPAVGGTSAAAAAAGTELNLKLGRNAYYEETQGGRGAGSTPPASAPLALAAGAGPSSAPSAQAVYAVGPPGKKQRLPSPNVQVCQVDGCKQDLSGSKEYHKRHKVCETHSKAPRVVAGGMEQRFCQQCSRFHGLSEFDEGKRSCRRRLAGHNERRRKPPPEPASIASSGNSSSVFQSEAGAHGSVSIEDRKRSNSGLAEQQACFITMQRTPGSSSTSVESDEQSGSLGTNFKLNHGKSSWPVLGRGDETTGLACQSPVTISERQPSYLSPVTERVLMFFQSPNGAIAGPGVHYPVESAAGSMAHGPGLTLASSSGPAGVLAGLDGPVSAHVSGMLDSGRALSLLSSHPRGSRVGGGASGSMSLAVSAAQSDVTLEQLISDDARNAFSPRGPQSRFHGSSSGSTDKLFRQPPREMQLSNPNRGGDNPPREQQQHRSLLPNLGMVGGYESHSMLSIMPEYRALQTPSSTQRPTIDLMQLPSPPAHSQFPEFSALRPFEGSLFDSQQMM